MAEVSQSYYEILGVSKDATIEEIRASYKQLALTKHPDRDTANPNATAEFQKIVEAWVALKDENKRAAYDRGTLDHMYDDDDNDDDDFGGFTFGFGGGGSYWCEECGTFHERQRGSSRGGGGFSAFFNAYFAQRFAFGGGMPFYDSYDGSDFDSYYSSRRRSRRPRRRAHSPPPKASAKPLDKPTVTVNVANGDVEIECNVPVIKMSRQDVAVSLKLDGKNKIKRIWRGTASKITLQGLDPATYVATVQLTNKQGVAEGRVSIEAPFEVPPLPQQKRRPKITILTAEGDELTTEQPFPSRVETAKPAAEPSPQPNPVPPKAQPETPKKATKKPVEPDTPAKKMSKLLDAAISKRSVEQITSLLEEIKSDSSLEASLNAGQLRAAHRIIEINNARKKVSDISTQISKLTDLAKIEELEAVIASTIGDIVSDAFEYDKRAVAEHKKRVQEFHSDTALLRDAISANELEIVEDWVKSLSKARRRDSLWSGLLALGQFVVSARATASKLQSAEDLKSINRIVSEISEEREQFEESHPEHADSAVRIASMVEQTAESTRYDMKVKIFVAECSSIFQGVARASDVAVLSSKLAEANDAMKSRAFSELTPAFTSKIRRVVDRNGEDDLEILEALLKLGSDFLSFESTEINALFADAWCIVEKMKDYQHCCSELVNYGVTLTDDDKRQLREDPTTHFERLKAEHDSKTEKEARKREAEERQSEQKRREPQLQQIAQSSHPQNRSTKHTNQTQFVRKVDFTSKKASPEFRPKATPAASPAQTAPTEAQSTDIFKAFNQHPRVDSVSKVARSIKNYKHKQAAGGEIEPRSPTPPQGDPEVASASVSLAKPKKVFKPTQKVKSAQEAISDDSFPTTLKSIQTAKLAATILDDDQPLFSAKLPQNLRYKPKEVPADSNPAPKLSAPAAVKKADAKPTLPAGTQMKDAISRVTPAATPFNRTHQKFGREEMTAVAEILANNFSSHAEVELAYMAPVLKQQVPLLGTGKGLCKSLVLAAAQAGIVGLRIQGAQIYVSLLAAEPSRGGVVYRPKQVQAQI